jgi:hypothetical protein
MSTKFSRKTFLKGSVAGRGMKAQKKVGRKKRPSQKGVLKKGL